MKIRHGLAIGLSGALWMGIGIFLLMKGFSLLLHPSPESTPLILPRLGSLVKDPAQASLVLVSIGLVIGFIKGRFILAKTAARIIKKIESLPNPCALKSVYGPGYLILLGCMMGMGIMLNKFSVPHDLRGIIDVAVGSALTNGSAFYFRHFAEAKRKKLAEKLK